MVRASGTSVRLRRPEPFTIADWQLFGVGGQKQTFAIDLLDNRFNTIKLMGRSRTAVNQQPLRRETIVTTALRLLEEDGLDRLSMARIAGALGVQTPALYWHVRDRGELLGMMAEELLRQTLDKLDREAVGCDFLIMFGRAVVKDQAERRDLAKLVAISSPTEAGYEQIKSRVLDPLAKGGIANPSEALMAVLSFTLGWSLFTTNPPMRAHLMRAMNPEQSFEAGLQAIAAGFGCSGDGR